MSKLAGTWTIERVKGFGVIKAHLYSDGVLTLYLERSDGKFVRAISTTLAGTRKLARFAGRAKMRHPSPRNTK